MTTTPLAPVSRDRLDRLSAIVQSRIDARHIPGAVLLLDRGGEIVLEQALGQRDPATAAPMTIDTIFRIYSMTKPIVSVGVMMLMEEGRLLISDPVAKYLPELGGLEVVIEEVDGEGNRVLKRVPAQRDMTVQDLLRHTAGLTYGIFGDSMVKRLYRESGVERRAITNAELVAALGKLPLAHQPGTVWEYSRATDVLGALIERISGTTLDVWLDTHILRPLGMRDSGFWVPPDQQHRLAEAFPVDPDKGVPVRLSDVRQRPSFLSGGGGMVSTARDYLRFARMLRNGGWLDGVRLLSRKTVQFMHSDHLTDLPDATRTPDFLPGPGYGFGLGFAVRRTTGNAWGPGSPGDFHWSGLAGTYFWIDPAEDLIAIWLMQAPEQRGEYRQLFRNLVYAAL